MSRAPDTPGTDAFELEIRREHDHAVVALRGEIDLQASVPLAEALEQASAFHPRVVVDLAGVRFLDASAIGTLAGVHRQLRGRGGDLVLHRPSDFVRRLLDVSGLADAVSIEPSSADEAPSDDPNSEAPEPLG